MVRKEDFYFDSREQGQKIHAVKWLPEIEKPHCILQIIHGMAEYIERYDEFARFLAEKGILVVGDDHLGHGKSVKEGGVYGYFCENDAPNVLVRDEHRLKKTIQEQYPGVKYLILGHSMGSFILRNYLLRYGTGVDGAIIVGTGMVPKAAIFAARIVIAVQKLFCGSKHTSKLLDKLIFGGYNKGFKPSRTPADWISKNEANVDKYIADPLCGFVFTVNGFETLMKLIDNCCHNESFGNLPKDLPMMMISGSDDPVGSYGKGVEQAYNAYLQYGMTNVRTKLYESDRHEVLNEADRELVYGDIYRWILQRLE
ncbi:MAG: alpha/beta hydrolase [Butyrivibrio sp.]|nr:alpha/beta hydrolase [Butyrivibrio sp.]